MATPMGAWFGDESSTPVLRVWPGTFSGFTSTTVLMDRNYTNMRPPKAWAPLGSPVILIRENFKNLVWNGTRERERKNNNNNNNNRFMALCPKEIGRIDDVDSKRSERESERRMKENVLPWMQRMLLSKRNRPLPTNLLFFGKKYHGGLLTNF